MPPQCRPQQQQQAHPRPSFPIMPASARSPSIPISIPSPSYKAPQHKHAHHLHSIPPREKSTRTLIVDHMLWLHGRARFAQAKAELERKEGDGEGEARTFRARADGLEKVLCAMLEQAPEEVSWDVSDDDGFLRDNAGSGSSPGDPTIISGKGLLPNGVRLRIALARLVNDTFLPGDVAASQISPSANPPLASLTPALVALSKVSAYAHQQPPIPKLPPFQTFTATAAGANGDPPAHSLLPPPGSIFSSIPRGAGSEAAWALGSSLRQQFPATMSAASFAGHVSTSSSSLTGPSSSSMPPPAPPRVFRAIGRSKELYLSGAYTYPGRPNIASSSVGSFPQQQASSRCPRHLTLTCSPSSFCSHNNSTTAPTTSASPKRKYRSNIGAGLTQGGQPLRRVAGASDAAMTELLPRFLRLSALVALELGREAREKDEDEDSELVGDGSRKGKRRESDASSVIEDVKFRARTGSTSSSAPSSFAARPTRSWYTLLASLLGRAALQGYLVKGWRGTDAAEVLMGLGVGAAPPHQKDEDDTDDEELEFEPEDMPSLLDAWHILFGFAGERPKDTRMSNGDAKVETPNDPYAEYERLMHDRISELFTIPAHCVDLSAHLALLSQNDEYHNETIDRECLKFFEAISSWRGEPEMENYKRMAAAVAQSPSTSTSSKQSALPSQPSSFIDEYFTPSNIPLARPPRTFGSPLNRWRSSSGANKRARRPSWAEAGTSTKRKPGMLVMGNGSGQPMVGRAWMEEDEYVGPYGI